MKIDLRRNPSTPPITRRYRVFVRCSECDWGGYRSLPVTIGKYDTFFDTPLATFRVRMMMAEKSCPQCGAYVRYERFTGRSTR